MAAATTETSTATTSANPTSPTSVVASEISGDSTQKLPGQSPKNGKMAAATTETSTATQSADPPPRTSIPPPLAASTTSETILDSSQENPNVQRGKPDLEPESDQRNGSIVLKLPSIKWGCSSLRKWIISGVLGSYTGLLWKRNLSFTL
jgi:hypothetical protein